MIYILVFMGLWFALNVVVGAYNFIRVPIDQINRSLLHFTFYICASPFIIIPITMLSLLCLGDVSLQLPANIGTGTIKLIPVMGFSVAAAFGVSGATYGWLTKDTFD